jgi:predicted transcriptional regulator
VKIRSIKVPPDLDREVGTYAAKRQLSRSAVVREALASYLRAETGAPGSFASAAADLAGTVSGPSDLAANPAHLEGYGRSRR